MERIKQFLSLFDIPGGVILGMWSLAMLVLACAVGLKAFHGIQVEIPQSVLTLYQWVLGAFAASKTLKTIFGKPVKE